MPLYELALGQTTYIFHYLLKWSIKKTRFIIWFTVYYRKPVYVTIARMITGNNFVL